MYYLVDSKQIVQSGGYMSYAGCLNHRKQVDPCDRFKWDVCFSEKNRQYLGHKWVS